MLTLAGNRKNTNAFLHWYLFVFFCSPVPTISWRKVNGFIPSKARLRKSQAVLEIPNVQLEDAGAYECKAENSRGKNAFRGQLQVYSKCLLKESDCGVRIWMNRTFYTNM